MLPNQIILSDSYNNDANVDYKRFLSYAKSLTSEEYRQIVESLPF